MTPDPEPPDPLIPPVVEAVAAGQVAAQAGETHGPTHTHCENCGTVLQGSFCHRCGQHDFDFNKSFGNVFHEALENFFHFDAKLFRNIITLLFRPGALPAEFNAGHRVAQMPPLRIYIFVSILFFFVSFAGGPPKTGDVIVNEKMNAKDRAELGPLLGQVKDEHPDKGAKIGQLQENLARVASPTAAKQDKKAKLADREEDSALGRLLQEKGQYAYEHQYDIAEAFIHAIPKMLLFCLPLFALYTRVLFRKAGQAYLQHLVVALHFHTFIFLWSLFRDGWAALADLVSHGLNDLILFAGGVWLTVYPVVMLRRLFADSWKRTILKTVALTLAYTCTLALAFATTALIIFATL